MYVQRQFLNGELTVHEAVTVGAVPANVTVRAKPVGAGGAV